MSAVTNRLSGNGSSPLLRLDLSDYVQTGASTNVILLYQNLGSSAFNGSSDIFILSDPGTVNDGRELYNGSCFYASGNGSLTNAFTMHYDYDVDTGTFGTGGNDIALTVIPEPLTVGLVFLLGGGLFAWRRLRSWRE